MQGYPCICIVEEPHSARDLLAFSLAKEDLQAMQDQWYQTELKRTKRSVRILHFQFLTIFMIRFSEDIAIFDLKKGVAHRASLFFCIREIGLSSVLPLFIFAGCYGRKGARVQSNGKNQEFCAAEHQEDKDVFGFISSL